MQEERSLVVLLHALETSVEAFLQDFEILLLLARRLTLRYSGGSCGARLVVPFRLTLGLGDLYPLIAVLGHALHLHWLLY